MRRQNESENLTSKHLMKSSKIAAAGSQKRSRRSGREEGPWKRIKTCGRLLPEELIVSEILPRLPVKSLMRFKSVCKSWQSIISGGDRRLIRSHLQGSRQQLRVLVAPSHRAVSGIVSFHFVQGRLSSNCVSEFLLGMPDLKDVDCACRPSHSDGLVLLSSSTKFSYESATGTRLHVCNPATREVVTLPTSNNINNPSRVKPRMLPNNAVALGLDPLTNKYKVVRIFYRSSDLRTKTCSLGVEVLTLGSRSPCWIPEQQDPPYPIWPCHHASTVEGVIYWLVDNALHRSSPRAIISFNLRDGKFGVIPPPPTWAAERNLDIFYKEASLSVLDGELCCSHSCGRGRHESVYRKGAWHINHSQLLGVLPLGRACDGRMLVYENYSHSFGYYDAGEHTAELISGSTDKWPTYYEEGEPWFYVHILPYYESLVPIFSENDVLGRNALVGETV